MADPKEKTVRDIGRALTDGAIREAVSWIFWIGIAGLLISAALHRLGYGWDDSDDRPAGVHSQVRVRIDHLTGCQYLESGAGGITPRLKADGRQVCRD